MEILIKPRGCIDIGPVANVGRRTIVMPAAFANANVIGYTKYAHAFLRELRIARAHLVLELHEDQVANL